MKDRASSVVAPDPVILRDGFGTAVPWKRYAARCALLLLALGTDVACSGGQRGSAPPGFNINRRDEVQQTEDPDAGTDAGSDAPGATDVDASVIAGGDEDAGADGAGGAGSEFWNADPYCGDGRWDEATEECEGFEPGYQGCTRLGFVAGALRCQADCTWDKSDCTGTESCTDGIDNDGDQKADCEDTECSDSCNDPCSDPVFVLPGTTLPGNLVGRTHATTASCGDGSEPYLAYGINVSTTGKLDVTLSTFAPLTLSVRSSCSSVDSEQACYFPTRATLDVTAGERLFVLVSGQPNEEGAEFLLQVTERQRACGDGVRDADDEPGPEGTTAEECDDFNVVDGDGCSRTCELETTEVDGDNESIGAADPVNLTDAWYAQIRPAGDVDYFIVEVIPPKSSLVVSTFNLGDGACTFNLQDTTLQILDTEENDHAVLALDDDGGEGRCAQAVAPALEPGVYTIAVGAAEAALPETFPYRLGISAGECGDEALTPGEECDDGNLEGGDGCSPTCTEE